MLSQVALSIDIIQGQSDLCLAEPLLPDDEVEEGDRRDADSAFRQFGKRPGSKVTSGQNDRNQSVKDELIGFSDTYLAFSSGMSLEILVKSS